MVCALPARKEERETCGACGVCACVQARWSDRTGEVVRVHLCEEKKERRRDGVFPFSCPFISYSTFLASLLLFVLALLFSSSCFPSFFSLSFSSTSACVCVCVPLFSFSFLLLVCRGVCVRVRVLVRGM